MATKKKAAGTKGLQVQVNLKEGVEEVGEESVG